MIQCPSCKTPLVTIERKNLEVDFCLKCKGVWFDKEELDLMPQVLGTANIDLQNEFAKVASHENLKNCVRCKKQMDKVTLAAGSDLILDRCSQDGLWFDSGELGRYLSAHTGSAQNQVLHFLGEVITFKKESL